MDINGDGQVSMAEFSSDWTMDDLAAFRSWDHNNDGIITPAECLAGQKLPEGAPASTAVAQASTGSRGTGGGGSPPAMASSSGSSGSRPSFSGSGFTGRSSSGSSSSGSSSPGSGFRSPGIGSGPVSGAPSAPSGAPSSTTTSTPSAGSSSSPANFSAGGQSQADRYRTIYTNMFHTRDVNKNGVLDGDEINPSIAKADRNGDGKITLAELLETFAKP
jgi:hypothetical protein